LSRRILAPHAPHLFISFFFLSVPRPPTSTHFPYTTLFRSRCRPRKAPGVDVEHRRDRHIDVVAREAALRAGHAEQRQSRDRMQRSEEHTSELQSRFELVCRLLLEKKKKHAPEHTRIQLEPK